MTHALKYLLDRLQKKQNCLVVNGEDNKQTTELEMIIIHTSFGYGMPAGTRPIGDTTSISACENN